MAWLKFDVTTPEKPEVLAITIALGFEDPDLTVGKLLKVWRWFDQHTVEGNAKNVTASLFDRLIGVTGIAQAMADVGWLVIHEGGLTLPNFETHNGKTAKDRALTATRAAIFKANAKSNATIVTDALPREEKRREDLNTGAKAPLSPAKLPACPHEALIDLFGQLLPTLPQPKKELWNGKNAEAMRARWRWVLTAKKKSGEPYAADENAAVDWFGRYFSHVEKSDFLTGRSGKWTGCDLGWLMKAENFTKVVQGNYDEKVTT